MFDYKIFQCPCQPNFFYMILFIVEQLGKPYSYHAVLKLRVTGVRTSCSHKQLLKCPLSRHLLMHHPSQTWVMSQLLKCPEMPVFILLSANLNWSSKSNNNKKNKQKTYVCHPASNPMKRWPCTASAEEQWNILQLVDSRDKHNMAHHLIEE